MYNAWSTWHGASPCEGKERPPRPATGPAASAPRRPGARSSAAIGSATHAHDLRRGGPVGLATETSEERAPGRTRKCSWSSAAQLLQALLLGDEPGTGLMGSNSAAGVSLQFEVFLGYVSSVRGTRIRFRIPSKIACTPQIGHVARRTCAPRSLCAHLGLRLRRDEVGPDGAEPRGLVVPSQAEMPGVDHERGHACARRGARQMAVAVAAAEGRGSMMLMHAQTRSQTTITP